MLCDVFCEKCAQAGRRTLARYILLAEEEALVRPMAAGQDGEPSRFPLWHRLCAPHHAELPEDEQMAYVPTVYASL